MVIPFVCIQRVLEFIDQTVRQSKVHIKKQFRYVNMGLGMKSFGENQEMLWNSLVQLVQMSVFIVLKI